MNVRAFAWLAICASCTVLVSSAHADGGAAPGGVDAGADAGSVTASGDIAGCVESLPKGAERPNVSETFPDKAPAGWAATLSITVRHGKGERVLPAGLDLSSATEARKVLSRAGFVVPEQDGGAGAQLWTEPEDKERSLSVTHLELPLVVLPDKPGRNTLILPAVPVAVARASGEIATICTHPHLVQVDDPTSNAPEAAPRPNPEPRVQREEWTALKKAVTWAGLGLVVGGLLAYVAYRIWTRPKPPVPPPPPRPPWEVALEKLEEVRRSRLLETHREAEYFDRVSDAVREYLGARFGFDGLESTTDEVLTALRARAAGFVRMDASDLDFGGPTPGISLAEIRRLLSGCDLVKFANMQPSTEQCEAALAAGERVVRTTMPTVAHGPGAPSSRTSPSSQGEMR